MLPMDAPPLDSILDLAATPRPAVAPPHSVASAPFGVHMDETAPGGTGGSYWVTAFGYAKLDALPAVLDELRPPGGDFQRRALGVGQWVHVCFGAKHEQQQALAKNGRIVHGMMLGVIEGVVPAGSESVVGKHNGAKPRAPLRLQQPRGAAHKENLLRQKLHPPAASETGLLASFNGLCEYAFGW